MNLCPITLRTPHGYSQIKSFRSTLMQIYFYYAFDTTNSSIPGTTNMLIQRIAITSKLPNKNGSFVITSKSPGVYPPLQNAGSTSGGWRSLRSSWQQNHWMCSDGRQSPAKWILNIWQIFLDSCWFIQSLVFFLKIFLAIGTCFCHNFPPPKKKNKKGDSILGVIGDSPQTMSDSMGLISVGG